jgi:hypothetical protein
MEALKYHLLPERRSSFQSPRTKPRKSTVGIMYAVGGIDCTKGNVEEDLKLLYSFFICVFVLFSFLLVLFSQFCILI